ncbi:helix-turn-helix domain-containing protein [Lactococcus lactis]|jgi:transcriptional regulator with XRE-family HTH domain|uniref:helix-turn-helix domain-containing protein n=1 Tax=Lactococcus lactis TaxID=1358 RepID=UPI00205CC224|nr:helix-turn-helix transcriptional regulator [Lactococcus lactis]MDG4958373.1 helix-turn-helix domain-containing protein [Lactococcus lactis]WKF72871.1 helix-turn-helix transcriptional regulator [Lactococcus lactis]BDH82387.1 hypothetical protein LLL8_20440 [Lactococcus lactis]
MIGKKLKEYRQNLKVTGETLANLAGMQRSYLSQIENEKKYPPLDTLINLVKAIAKISPITEYNRQDILTEELYKDFRNSITYSVDVLHQYSIVIELLDTGISRSLFSEDENPTNEEIEETIKSYFISANLRFPDALGIKNVAWNLEEVGPHNLIDTNELLYNYSELRESLYEWWYNFILEDFIKNGVKDSVIYVDKEINEIDRPLPAYDVDLSEGDRKLLAELWPLMDENGVFTSNDDEDSINVTKGLLDGKTVTFDLKEISDKNVRLLLNGQLLTNPEKAMLKVALDAIKYNR